MKRILLTIAYDGTRYSGWQKQKNPDVITVEGELTKALQQLFREPTLEIIGASRTDAGVHALGQVANFHAPSTGNQKDDKVYSIEEIQATLNEYLSKDIRVLKVEIVDERFHARLTAKGKTYEYRIDNGAIANVFHRKFVMREEDPLDLDAMRTAASYFIGTHDFKTFCANKKMKKSTVRFIRSVEFKRCGEELRIYYTGNGFLQNMVRILTGTLIEVGRGERSAASIPVLFGLKRSEAGSLAPAQGLCLEEVFY